MGHGLLFTSFHWCNNVTRLLISHRKVPKRRHWIMEHTKQTRHSSNSTTSYEAAVEALNSLQSNASVLERARLQKDRHAVNNVPCTEKYLARAGISLATLDNRLKIIHVSGTKGKGSTCAFCESILKYHGLKTGFYSSPHLVEVRERIRINGKPLNKSLFAHYFWEVFSSLQNQKEDNDDMPAYFKFMTVMAFHVFLKEEVDVAIVEVGIGGLYDCTNIIRKPVVVGISSLGLDHVSLLGDTVEKIAVHKAGIMKPDIPTFTLADQPGDSLSVLTHRAQEIQCPLYTVPALDEYRWSPYQMKLGLPGRVQFKNASLALQLSRAFLMLNKNPKVAKYRCMPFQIHSADALGLSLASWPGRSQIIHRQAATYYIDGAHTPESIQVCVEWFRSTSTSTATKKILIFNTTGDRNAHVLMTPLQQCNFHVVIFCPNVVDKTDTSSKDLINMMVTKQQQLERCEGNKNVWQENNAASSKSEDVFSVPSINSALQLVQQYTSSIDHVDVLVTGSLHLVGGVLSILDPELSFLDFDKEMGEQQLYQFQVGSNRGVCACAVPGTP